MTSYLSNLPYISTKAMNRPLGDIVRLIDKKRINLKPPYQRDSVWPVTHQRRLIHSLLTGLPINAIILNQYEDHRGISHWNVIDGQQRLNAITGFIRGEFSVPSAWFKPEQIKDEVRSKEMISGLDLTDNAIDAFGLIILPVSYTQNLSLTQEAQFYVDMNKSAVHHDIADLDRARHIIKESE